MPVAAARRFIVVEGPIGVGKTSLARRLSQSLGGQLVLEQADQNPFLERFYKNPRAAAFQTQLFFLFQRARQLEDVRQEDLFGAVRVADYLLEKDRLFARVTLDDAEYAAVVGRRNADRLGRVLRRIGRRVGIGDPQNRGRVGASPGLKRECAVEHRYRLISGIKSSHDAAYLAHWYFLIRHNRGVVVR